jgi:hypothetical protein
MNPTAVSMNDEQRVKEKWPDAELSSAFAIQPDKSRRWMWCVMSSLKFASSRGKKKRVLNVGHWRFSESAAWADASRVVAAEEGTNDEKTARR